MVDNLDAQLGQILASPDQPGYVEATNALHQLVAALERALAPGSVQITLEPGYQTNLGLQINAVVRVPARQFQEVLFRAYVPVDGWPVSLDLGDKQPKPCGDVALLTEEFLGFVRSVRQRLDALREIAAEAVVN